jgi:hypothetical protein
MSGGALFGENAERYRERLGEGFQGLSCSSLKAAFDLGEECLSDPDSGREFGLSETPVLAEEPNSVVASIDRSPNLQRKTNVITPCDSRIGLCDGLPNPLVFVRLVLTGTPQEFLIVGQRYNDELLASLRSNDLWLAHRSLPLAIYFAAMADRSYEYQVRSFQERDSIVANPETHSRLANQRFDIACSLGCIASEFGLNLLLYVGWKLVQFTLRGAHEFDSLHAVHIAISYISVNASGNDR